MDPTSNQQRAVVVQNPGNNYEMIIRDDIPIRKPGPDEILVKLTCTGLCHSEIRAVLAWGAYNRIIGHEGVGTVIQAGPNVSPSLLHQRVGVKWLYSACTTCSACQRGFNHYCAQQKNTSRHVPGTLQQYIIADARFITRIPETVSDEIAAPLLCAGLTMAGAVGRLNDYRLSSGDWVVISGSGGGLGHLGVQIAARTKGFRVIAVDSGEEKRKVSMESGAEVFVDYRTEDVAARIRELVRNMGLIVGVGLPPNEMQWPISATVSAARGLCIVGSSVGTEEQMDELLQQAGRGEITPSIEVFDFVDTPRLVDGLRNDAISGRAVVRIPQ
ncbi:putative quinone oxidoreductase [Aspergillus bombycis]|uniref:Putative quinone oxidoreductase n=1 Tax=Aspergillus bombycis TaxID=109264 RepID=A0A1F8ADH6_9EURO|nr:putative quinone oxidoreductase [Aspergillus bombycis]OGM49796.1 putative quinone oxidoreductase [Aspergillus bombycis]